MASKEYCALNCCNQQKRKGSFHVEGTLRGASRDLRENKPCPSCIVSQSVFNALLSGIAVPMISLPYLSYYVDISASDVEAHEYEMNNLSARCFGIKQKHVKVRRTRLLSSSSVTPPLPSNGDN
ncbi:hypothetical protein Tcan_06922 [Toxocara canis]|uniref:Uncharacterized protein n=1 Tax=Toxocara canis TaxID=6265 RepID=A0A0B2V189_TOXCA|nr:hypothetical protein Tcan_06922 [Toxocara canis]